MKIKNHASVAQFLDQLTVGGKERIAVLLANGLADLGYKSFIISSRGEGRSIANVLPNVQRWCANRSWRWDFAGIRRIAEYIDANEFDIVHSHNHSSSYLLRVVLKFSKHKPLHVVHDHRSLAMRERKTALYDQLMLRHVDAYITVTDELRKRAIELLSLPRERCIFVPNGIVIRPVQESLLDKPTVIQVANLRKPKGHATAIQAAALLRRSIPDLKWICVGRIANPPDKYAKEVYDLVQSLGLKNCVRLTGECDDVRPLLRQAHLGVLTSDSEGLPLTLLEYMAEQLPVVITDVGLCGVLVREAEAGLVVPPRNAERFAEALLDIFSNEERARRMGKKGRAYVAKHFSVEAMTQEIHMIYSDLLSKRE
jgi:glycosyltransferase involved in cell wall biosynthesis